jgi:hypothetical protein
MHKQGLPYRMQCTMTGVMGTTEEEGVAGVGTMGAHMAMATVMQPAATLRTNTRKVMGTGVGEVAREAEGTEAGVRDVGVVAGVRGGAAGVVEEQEMSMDVQQAVWQEKQQLQKQRLLHHHRHLLLQVQRQQQHHLQLSKHLMQQQHHPQTTVQHPAMTSLMVGGVVAGVAGLGVPGEGMGTEVEAGVAGGTGSTTQRVGPTRPALAPRLRGRQKAVRHLLQDQPLVKEQQVQQQQAEAGPTVPALQLVGVAAVAAGVVRGITLGVGVAVRVLEMDMQGVAEAEVGSTLQPQLQVLRLLHHSRRRVQDLVANIPRQRASSSNSTMVVAEGGLVGDEAGDRGSTIKVGRGGTTRAVGAVASMAMQVLQQLQLLVPRHPQAMAAMPMPVQQQGRAAAVTLRTRQRSPRLRCCTRRCQVQRSRLQPRRRHAV